MFIEILLKSGCLYVFDNEYWKLGVWVNFDLDKLMNFCVGEFGWLFGFIGNCWVFIKVFLIFKFW